MNQAGQNPPVILQDCKPLQYFSQYSHAIDTGTPVFLVNPQKIIGDTRSRAALLLSTLPESTLREMLPKAYAAGLNGQSLSGLHLWSHENPSAIFGQLALHGKICIIDDSLGASYDDIVQTVEDEFGAVTVERGNPNMSPQAGMEDALYDAFRTELGKGETAEQRLSQQLLHNKKEFLKTLFRAQRLQPHSRVLLKCEITPNKNAEVSLVTTTEEIDQYGKEGCIFFFADQNKTFQKLFPQYGIDVGNAVL